METKVYDLNMQRSKAALLTELNTKTMTQRIEDTTENF